MGFSKITVGAVPSLINIGHQIEHFTKNWDYESFYSATRLAQLSGNGRTNIVFLLFAYLRIWLQICSTHQLYKIVTVKNGLWVISLM